MDITLKKLKSVWIGKANPDKKKIQERFNESFDLKANNSIRSRLGKVRKPTKLTDDQFTWFITDFGLSQK